MARFRQRKNAVRAALSDTDWAVALDGVDAEPGQLVGPLLSLRLDREETVRWRAVEALGRATAQVAALDMAEARTLMRTYMWYMNEESGNLGWGIPEIMGCACALDERIAKEFHKILDSYVRTEERFDGNYLDHAELRRGVFWAIGRLAGARPALARHALPGLLSGLADEDGANRGLAARALGILGHKDAAGAIAALVDDPSAVRFWTGKEVRETTTGELAREALDALGD